MLLEELQKLRKENQDGHNHTKMSRERLEQEVTDIRDQLEERIGPIDERTSRRHSYATPDGAVIPATKQTDTQQRGFFRFQREVKEMI